MYLKRTFQCTKNAHLNVPKTHVSMHQKRMLECGLKRTFQCIKNAHLNIPKTHVSMHQKRMLECGLNISSLGHVPSGDDFQRRERSRTRQTRSDQVFQSGCGRRHRSGQNRMPDRIKVPVSVRLSRLRRKIRNEKVFGFCEAGHVEQKSG